MGTATKVPETRDMSGDELSADEALTSLRRYGRWPLLRDSFIRFRYADGFSHSRALALQTVLSVIPLAIAFVGLSTALHTENIGRLAELTIHRLAQGPSADVVDDALDRSRRSAGNGAQIALWFGLLFSMVNVTTAMCQIERGANRIYGNERDRPFRQKYLRGLVMSLSAGLPLGLGFIVMVAGGDLAAAAVTVYGLDGDARTVCEILRWPFGLLLALLSASADLPAFPPAPTARLHLAGLRRRRVSRAVDAPDLAAEPVPGHQRVLRHRLRPAQRLHVAADLGLPDLHRPLSGAVLRRAAGGGAGAAARSDQRRPGSLI